MLVKLQIDAAHSQKLVRGKPVTIKVPVGAKQIELRLSHSDPAKLDSFAKICDVFFNGRPA
jgi:hypothetical protein